MQRNEVQVYWYQNNSSTEKGFDAEIFAVAAAEAQDYVENSMWMLYFWTSGEIHGGDFKKNGAKGIPVGVIQWLITE